MEGGEYGVRVGGGEQELGGMKGGVSTTFCHDIVSIGPGHRISKKARSRHQDGNVFTHTEICDRVTSPPLQTCREGIISKLANSDLHFHNLYSPNKD
jgi:hypothetical protein